MSNAGGSGTGRWLRPDQVVCAACGAANQQGSRFCERCGTRLPQRPGEQVGYRPPSPTPAPTPPSAPPATPPPNLASDTDLPDAGMPVGLEGAAGEPARGAPAGEVEMPGRAVPPPDATIVFRPDVSAPVEPAPGTTPTGAAQAPGPAEQPAAPGFDRDARTISFETPVEPRPSDPGERPDQPPETAAPAPATTSRDAQTLAFEVPTLPRADEPGEPGGPGDMGETGEPAVARAEETGDRPPLAVGRPPRPATEPEPVGAAEGAQPPPAPPPDHAPPDEGPSSAAWAPPMAAQPARATPPPVAPPIASAPTAPLPTVGPPTAPPAVPPPSAQYVTYPSPPAGAGSGSPVAPPPQPAPVGQLAQAPAYAPTAYPAAPAARGNRTLWIIVGVLGGLMLLCAMACVLLALLGAFSGASSVNTFATGVATVVATPRR